MSFPFKFHALAVGLFVWGVLFLFGFFLLNLFPWNSESFGSAWFYLLMVLGALCFVVYPQRIVVSDGIVTVRSGLWVMKRILLTDVIRVYASKGWPPSHTLRPVTGWRLSDGRSDYLVIPEDEQAFFDEVSRQAPHLYHYGNELRATPHSELET